MYRILVYAWDEDEPRMCLDFTVKENGWKIFHELCKIGPDARENIRLVEYWHIIHEEKRCDSLATCSF